MPWQHGNRLPGLHLHLLHARRPLPLQRLELRQLAELLWSRPQVHRASLQGLLKADRLHVDDLGDTHTRPQLRLSKEGQLGSGCASQPRNRQLGLHPLEVRRLEGCG